MSKVKNKLKGFSMGSIAGTFNVKAECTFEPNGRWSPEERNVWVAAMASSATLFPGMSVELTAVNKGKYADAILDEYRKRFMVREYTITSGPLIPLRPNVEMDPKLVAESRMWRKESLDKKEKLWRRSS